MNTKRNSLFVAFLCTVGFSIVAYSSPHPTPDKDTTLAQHFLSQVFILEADLQNRPHLTQRPALQTISEQASRDDWASALTTFRDYYLEKLAHAGAWLGIPDDLLDPSKDLNTSFRAVITDNHPQRRREVISVANQIRTDGLDAHKATSWTGMGALMTLLEAYVYEPDPRYLEAWCDIADDWATNERHLRDMRPLYMMPDESKGAPVAYQLMRLLIAVATTSPEAHREIRPDTLARVLTKLVRYYPYTTELYHRSNPHHSACENVYMLCWLGAMWDEFHLGEYYLERGMAMFERYGSTHVLPDGADVLRVVGYNFIYLIDGSHLVRLIDSLYPDPAHAPAWKNRVVERRWVEEQRALLRDRARYLLRMSTPDRGLPIGMRGDYREFPVSRIVNHAPEVITEPDNAIIRALLFARNPQRTPPPASDAMPWGGYFWQREGWGTGSAHAFMINNPLVGDHGFIGRSANNAFGLSAYGMDMLEIGVDGPYSIRPSPILIDGQPQNLNAGVFLTDPPPTEPMTNRWFASDAIDLAEAVYSGPYTRPIRRERAHEIAAYYWQAIRDATHRRQLIYLKDAAVWLCVDRLHSPSSRTYELVWRLPGPPSALAPMHTFNPENIRIVGRSSIVHTEDSDQPNLSLYHTATAPLSLSIRTKPSALPTRLTVPTDIPVTFQGVGTHVVTTLIHPRPDRSSSLRRVRQQHGTDGVAFSALTPNGTRIAYQVSPNNQSAPLSIGEVRIQGELLLLQQSSTRISGLALGASELHVDGNRVDLPHPDVYFELQAGTIHTTPIIEPVMPMHVQPARQGFTGAQTITMTCPTPDVEIRYTLDGSEPAPTSTLYTAPFEIQKSTLVRARAYRIGLTENPLELSGRRASPPVWAYYEQLDPIPAVTPGKTEPGLHSAHYVAHWIELLQNLDTVQPRSQRTVSRLFEKWDELPAPETLPANTSTQFPTSQQKSPPYYGLRYTGYLDVPQDGVYTFHAPDHLMRDNLAAGYALQVVVAGHTWAPVTRRHSFGTWSIALQKGLHPFTVDWIDYRGSAVADYYHRALRVNWIWNGETPPLLLSGPDHEPQPIPDQWVRRALTSK